MNKFDAIIIGFGKAGKTLAADLANHGKQVAIIEQPIRMYGRSCFQVGCIPTKSLVYSSKLAQSNKLESFEQQALFYEQAINNKNKLTAMLRDKDFTDINSNPNLVIFAGKASFASSTVVKVEIEQETIYLQGDKIFINSGSESVVPPIEHASDNKHVYTSESMLDVSNLPGRLVVIGGGYIGLEYASMYANFGSKVTVIQQKNEFLPDEDDDIAEEVQKVLIEKGIEFKMGMNTQSIVDNGNETIIHYTDSQSGQSFKHEADAVLLTAGRKPNTEDLNLSAAGIEVTTNGAVKVDDYLRTNIPRIWAMGDVAGGLQFTYVSIDDYRIIRDQLFGKGERSTRNRNIPYSMFIDPAFSRVGLNEKEAREQGYVVKTATFPVKSIPMAQVINETKGMLKAVVDGKTNRILGAILFCAESYELINLIKLAMDVELPYTFLKDQMCIHPTFSEALNDLFSEIQ